MKAEHLFGALLVFGLGLGLLLAGCGSYGEDPDDGEVAGVQTPSTPVQTPGTPTIPGTPTVPRPTSTPSTPTFTPTVTPAVTPRDPECQIESLVLNQTVIRRTDFNDSGNVGGDDACEASFAFSTTSRESVVARFRASSADALDFDVFLTCVDGELSDLVGFKQFIPERGDTVFLIEWEAQPRTPYYLCVQNNNLDNSRPEFELVVELDN